MSIFYDFNGIVKTSGEMVCPVSRQNSFLITSNRLSIKNMNFLESLSLIDMVLIRKLVRSKPEPKPWLRE